MNPDARLRRALAPVDPPEGFAQRVRARVAEQARASQPAPRRATRWMAIAATVLAVLGGLMALRIDRAAEPGLRPEAAAV